MEACHTIAGASVDRLRGCLALVVLSVLTAAVTPVIAADSEASAAVGRTAVARPAAEWDQNGKPVKLEFDFGDVRAWVRRDGSWNAEGSIQHRGLLLKPIRC